MNVQPRDRHLHRVGGFTLLELMFVITIICILLAMLLPAVRTAREPARRMVCSNHMKQLGLALHHYHHAHNHFPSAMGGTDGPDPQGSNAGRLSGLVALLPFLEHQALWEDIASSREFDGVVYPAMGPAPWVADYPPWRRSLSVLQCPSVTSDPSEFGNTNYAFCIGDMAQSIHQLNVLRGAFACGMVSRLDDMIDGTSNTIALGEIGNRSGRTIAGQVAIYRPAAVLDHPARCYETVDSKRPTAYDGSVRLSELGRGGRWADGAAGFGLMNTILTPNRPSCAIDGAEAVDGLYSSGSEHANGMQVAMVDGSVRFIADSIDGGDSHHPTLTPQQLASDPLRSPYGVWGALGTREGGESLDHDF